MNKIDNDNNHKTYNNNNTNDYFKKNNYTTYNNDNINYTTYNNDNINYNNYNNNNDNNNDKFLLYRNKNIGRLIDSIILIKSQKPFILTRCSDMYILATVLCVS